MRKIIYISGTRADFGLMQSTLVAIAADRGLDLSIIATGMHLDARYGRTIDEIRSAKLKVAGEVPVPLVPANGATMAKNIGQMISAIVPILEEQKPDILVLLGDRGEMLAAAIAGLHLNIFIVHIHGGERSGTIDEPVRHAVSKLSHFHFCATQDAKNRLVKMGENPDDVFVTGAPGLSGISDIEILARPAFAEQYGFDPQRKIALLVFHPVLQEAATGGEDTNLILESLVRADFQILALHPNSDAGSDAVADMLTRFGQRSDICNVTHLERPTFLTAMACADVMIGNSSAGIIEAASFGTPVINIGRRQNLRERNANITDLDCTRSAIEDALDKIAVGKKLPVDNIYGDGQAASRILDLLKTLQLVPDKLHKVNSY